jgi:predicted nucleic-acid-binding protein
MIAVDTNILVRYAVRDEPSQTLIVTQFLANHRCFILKTVLLELVWVLESDSGYALPRRVVLENKHDKTVEIFSVSHRNEAYGKKRRKR